MTNTNRESGNSVAAVAKALHTLRAFVDGQEKWGVRELASSLGLPPSTTHRLLATLRREGFLQQNGEEPEYTVGFEFTRLAAAVLQRNELHEVAGPVMREISETTGESVWLALYDATGQRIAYIAESEAIHASRYMAPLGREEGVVDSACGIAILASLSDEQRQHAMTSARARMSADKLLALDAARHAGYAILRSTEVESAMIVAAAIKDSGGRCLGSLGMVVPLHRFGDGQGKIYGDCMQDACRRISTRLGARILGGSRSGSWGDAIGLINQTVKQYLPALPITPMLGGGTRNLDALGTGMGAYGLTTSSSLYDAYHGRGPFKSPLKNLRSIMNLSELHLLILAKSDMEIGSMEDVARLRISPGEQGFSAAHIFEHMIECLRSTKRRRFKASNLSYLDYPEGMRQFEEGGIDALFWLSGLENPIVKELEQRDIAQLVPLDNALLEELLRINPGFHSNAIQPSAFPRWLSDITPLLAVHTVLVCTADRPADEVHKLTQAIFERREELSQMSSVYRRLNKDFASERLVAPRHPGASRFFAELEK